MSMFFVFFIIAIFQVAGLVSMFFFMTGMDLSWANLKTKTFKSVTSSIRVQVIAISFLVFVAFTLLSFKIIGLF